MQNNLLMFPDLKVKGNDNQIAQTTAPNYHNAEQQFIELLATENLDNQLEENASKVWEFEQTLSTAITAAYGKGGGDDVAHRFLQRILYRINRLKLFWYDDLRHYDNERSLYLLSCRNKIEAAWQKWELSQIDVFALQQLNVTQVKQALIERATVDVDPPLSPESRYIREEMSEAGYRHLLAIGSFDGLVEGSRMTFILGGAANEVQCTLVRVFLEEYGNGRLSRKHSTYFAQMLAEFGMNTAPEAYFDLVPWEVLACDNHNFLTTERKRYFLRYSGALTYFEVAGPAAYRNYLTAAQRLGLSEAAMGYWELHIREDERHGRWMLDDVALALAEQYPNDAWELLLGYDQEKLMGDRAAKAVVCSIRAQEQ
ncbi:iron-containing redox enzyme family protein [Calothrix sp. FACHB-1219]|uniref:iron-containing redox enzyme family protein n=1 Tax=unclassified Calothrix TaxID=2619626 RepID=UPI00168663A0|nr:MULTISPECIES: iron-containing redox enzyme family protein [unclassified Calothrix]MBD2202594.1 iron-containing redox enzyme family protein [Calothrix sp. FACHB-168]MBD2217816.1 iron-containing redox enzyme family protein [Calothrix sp. FACHB-1219]